MPRDSAGENVRRPLGAITALALAIVVSLFGTSLSVGRQPEPDLPLSPTSFQAIVPPAGLGLDLRTEVQPEAIPDFHNEASLVTRVTSGVPVPAHRVRARVRSVQKAAPKPVMVTTGNSRSVRGIATWYCKPGVSSCTSGYRGGLYAAAGSELRIGNWRGRVVKVCGNGRCVTVKLIDWCACGGTRIIDLYNDAFSVLASPSRGGISVTVSW